MNIVNIIEKNPLTKLNQDYQNKFIQKIQCKFSTDHQQLFIGSFYGYLNYNSKTDFIIDLNDIWKWLGFSRKSDAKKVLTKHFIENVDFKIVLRPTPQNSTGRPNETVLMNLVTFKKLCLKSNTSKADSIHNYFIELEEVLQEIVSEESDELKQQLSIKEREIEKKDLKVTSLIEGNKYEKQNLLLTQYSTNESIVYIIKVKSYENGEYIIKIGESRRGIINRFNEHKKKYQQVHLLDCFKVEKSKDFETFLHQKLRDYKCKTLEHHENENELFLIGKNICYNDILDIIKHNIHNYQNHNITSQELDIQKLQLLDKLSDKEILTDLKISNDRLYLILNDMAIQLQNLTEKNALTNNTITTNFSNEILPTIGDRLQKINPETLNIVQVFETVSECIKQNPIIKRSSLNKAINDNTIYHGFRWLLIDRSLDPNIIHQIQETKTTKIQNLGYIAKLNNDKTEILNVYLNRKSASLENNYPSSSSLDIIVKKSTLSNGNYYMLYDDCSDNLKQNFIIKNKNKPILYLNGIGQFNESNLLIQEFVSKHNCCQTLGISEKSLSKAITKNIMYNKFYYRFLESKIKCFDD
jgi:hypothetical protein